MICPCRLHSMTRHPSTYRYLAGEIVSIWTLCWCECDHTTDEERWAA